MMIMSNGNIGAGAGMGGMTPAELERVESLKKTLLQNILTKEARERLNRVRIVKPELAMQIELYLIQMYQAGKITTQLTDDQLKDILNMLSSEKKFNILKK